MEMVHILKHELSPIPLSLAKAGGDMNSTPKSDLVDMLMTGLYAPSEVPEASLKMCVLIYGHALIQALGKSQGCQTFGDYAERFMQIVTHYFIDHTTRVDILFDRYAEEDSIKSMTCSMGQIFHYHRFADSL